MIQTLTESTYAPLVMDERHAIPTNDIPVSTHKWRQRKKIIVIPLVLFGIIIGTFILGPLHWTSGSQGRSVFGTTVSALGVLQAPVYNLVFSSTVTGTISDIYVNLGQKVVKNQALALLGHNTYVAQLHAAQVAVDASRDEVNAAERHVDNEFQFIKGSVELAKTVYQAELHNRQALNEQAHANINFARVTLSADETTLDAVTVAANAAIRSATLTLQTALAACQKAAASTSTTTSTQQRVNNLTFATCVKAAKAALQQAVTAAKVTVVTAQGTVDKDNEALNQACANAKVNLTAVNGRISAAKAGISVARDNPDRTNAILSLTSAEFTYKTSLAALLIAQENLALTTLRAPHDGIVTAIIGTIGGQPGAINNLVPAGGLEIQSEHGGLTFIQLIDTSHINQVLTYVDETDIAKIRIGQTVSFTLKAFKDHPLTGTINTIAPNGLGFPGTTMPADTKFPVIVSINTQSTDSLNLYSGMTGTVSITT
jgi:multidrug efflux pump subunit AcrA (membrane-fusion protein)